MSLRVERHVNGRWRQNCYVVGNRAGEALIVDPGSDAAGVEIILERQNWRPLAIVNTHGHYDHIGAVADLMERFDLPFFLHRGDVDLVKRANLYRLVFESRQPVRIPKVTHQLSGASTALEIGSFRGRWLATPGHTPGSVCLELGECLFTGDLVMANGIGRADLPGGDAEQLQASLQALTALSPSLRLLAGHGPEITLGTALTRHGIAERSIT
jgi:glyoxylase-like metal-dependent hydrolase (beta-lactamase superfamily II)